LIKLQGNDTVMTPFRTLFLALFLHVVGQRAPAQPCGTDTISLQLQWEYGTGLSLPIHAEPDENDPGFLYVAAKSGGLIILNVSVPGQATLSGTLPVASFNGLEVMNCEQHGNYLFVALGNYFGTDVQQAGMAIVDVSDPESPEVKDVWDNQEVVKGACSVKVQDDYAYLAAMNDGLIILDISDKNNIQFVSRFIPDPNWPVENPVPTAVPNARSLQVEGDIVYLCYDAGGLRIINVHDKLNPKETGRYINPQTAGKQQAYNDITIHDGLAYIGVDYCGMEIVNVTDTSNLVQAGWWNPWDCTSPSNIWIGSHGHGNEVTYHEQQQIIFMSAGASDLRIIDVSDPANPDSCSGFGSFADTLASYGASVSGERVFITYIIAVIPYFSVWAGVKELKWESAYNAVGESVINEEVRISPNPFYDRIEVSIPGDHSEGAQVYVRDPSGRTLITEFIRAGSDRVFLIRTSMLPPGMYLVSIVTEKGSVTASAVKQD
jgi:hypothetical protein